MRESRALHLGENGVIPLSSSAVFERISCIRYRMANSSPTHYANYDGVWELNLDPAPPCLSHLICIVTFTESAVVGLVTSVSHSVTYSLYLQ